MSYYDYLRTIGKVEVGNYYARAWHRSAYIDFAYNKLYNADGSYRAEITTCDVINQGCFILGYDEGYEIEIRRPDSYISAILVNDMLGFAQFKWCGEIISSGVFYEDG